MTAKNQVPTNRSVTFTPDGAVMRATYAWHTFRFLLSDGTTLDVSAVWDDSNLRHAVLEHTGAERIEGVALLPEEVPKPEPPKKRVAKRAEPRQE